MASGKECSHHEAHSFPRGSGIESAGFWQSAVIMKLTHYPEDLESNQLASGRLHSS